MTFRDLAVLGTAHHQGVPASGTGIDEIAAALALDTVERRTLLTVGALATYRRAGHRPVSGIAPPPVASPDTQREPPLPAVRLLRELLAHDDHVLLREACERVARGGKRLPATLLPTVLDLRDADLRTALRPVLGERGRWLARFRESWSWALASTPPSAAAFGTENERAWQEGSFEARLAALGAARLADPDRGRGWVEAVWAQEKSEQRVEFLRALSGTLVSGDEPFLEQALDDRSQGVRAAAAELLAKLPGSSFVKRVTERAAAVLSFRPPAGGLWSRVKSKVGAGSASGTVDATPPETLDPSWERDGVPRKPPKGLGERAHWVTSLLASVPPAYWQERFAAAPEQLVAATWAGEWGFAVALGWSRAALLHEATSWLPPLWDGWLAANLKGVQQATQQDMLRLLLARMERAAAETRVLDVLRNPPGDLLDPALAVGLLSAPWSTGFADAYLDAFDREFRSRKPALEFLRTGYGAALALPPERFTRATEVATRAASAKEGHTPWTKSAEAVLEIVDLRRRIHEEIVT